MKRRTTGQLLIEIIVGLGIITTVLVVSLTLVTHAARLSVAARNRLEATKYAEKVIETLRNTRDADKDAFFDNETCNPSCGTFGPNNIYSCAMACTFSPAGNANRVEVTVTMTWTDGPDVQTLPLSTILTRYDL